MKLNSFLTLLTFFWITSCTTQTAPRSDEADGFSSSSGAVLSLNGGSSGMGSSQSSIHYSDHLISSNSSSFKGVYGTMVDARDGQMYSTITIQKQEWMATNLNYGSFVSDGKNSKLVQKSGQKFCLDNYEPNCHYDGGLYQWHNALGLDSVCSSQSCSPLILVSGQRGICPEGWHIPSSADWDTLMVNLGGYYEAGKKMKMNLTTYSSWNDTTHNDGNSSGFSALPVGYRFNFGVFKPRGTDANFWMAAESDLTTAEYVWLGQFISSLATPTNSKLMGYSVRCLRD